MKKKCDIILQLLINQINKRLENTIKIINLATHSCMYNMTFTIALHAHTLT